MAGKARRQYCRYTRCFAAMLTKLSIQLYEMMRAIYSGETLVLINLFTFSSHANYRWLVSHLSRSKSQRNVDFSNPLFFELPDNSNQKSFLSPQSKAVILHPISRTGRVFKPIFVCLGGWIYRDFTVGVNFAL